MKRYLSMIRVGILDALQFRLALIVTTVGNLLYLVLVYFLWKSIFASAGSDVINGMTFTDTMIYLVFASSLFNFMEMWIVWNMGRAIQTGSIVVDLLKPANYLSLSFFSGCGETVVKFVTTFFPTAVVVFLVSRNSIPLGLNVLLFMISCSFSLVINYYINFMVGTICMYTDTIWGINIMKVVIVSLLSGATIPLAFFPDTIRSWVMFLPFHAIINTPLTVLLSRSNSLEDNLMLLLIQLCWLVGLRVLASLFFNVSVKRITVNGG